MQVFRGGSSSVICPIRVSGLAWGYGFGEEALRGRGLSHHITRSTITCHLLMSTLAACLG